MVTTTEDHATLIARWAKRRRLTEFTVRDVAQSGVLRRNNADRRDPILDAFEELERLGFGRIDWVSKRSVVFMVSRSW
jgi:hypothetical protein